MKKTFCDRCGREVKIPHATVRIKELGKNSEEYELCQQCYCAVFVNIVGKANEKHR